MRISMRFNATILALSVALLLSGCSSVTIPHPLSTQPKPLDKDKFEGTWLIEKGTVDVRFASNGVAQIAGVEWKDEHFRLVQGEMIVTEGQKDNFISIRFAEDGVWTNRYFFLQYTFTDNGDLVLWPPNTSEFEAAIRTNILQGVVTKEQYGTSISVTNSPADLLDFMNDPQRLDLFEYRKPTVLRRIIAPEKAEPCEFSAATSLERLLLSPSSGSLPESRCSLMHRYANAAPSTVESRDRRIRSATLRCSNSGRPV